MLGAMITFTNSSLSPMAARMLAQMDGSDIPVCYPDGGEHRDALELLLGQGLVREVGRDEAPLGGHRCFVLTDAGRPVAADLAKNEPYLLRDDTARPSSPAVA